MLPLLQRMSSDLSISAFTLAELARTAPYRYKVFTIPKRNGEPRTIAQPAHLIKVFQRWLASNELSLLPIHEAAVAYRVGSKIVRNAAAHSDGRFLLKMDFSDFFPSIGDADLQQHLRKYGNHRWDDQDIELITNVVLWLPKRARSRQLCIGGPSSPVISNTIMYDFDRTVSELCGPLGVIYTRYADDLAFSTSNPNVLGNVEKEVGLILEGLPYPRLRLNRAKTVRTSRADLRRVTGLTITPQGLVSIGRERKREIRSKLYLYVNRRLPADDAQMLKGLLAFCLDVEPDFVGRLKEKYGADAVAKVLSLKKAATPR